MIEGKLTIETNVSEQELMENLLNQYYSGYFVQHYLMIYALGKRWHIDKFTYYWNMLGGNKK